jgi:hypothetical protein
MTNRDHRTELEVEEAWWQTVLGGLTAAALFGLALWLG